MRETSPQTGALVLADGRLDSQLEPFTDREQAFFALPRPLRADEALYFDLVRATLVMRRISKSITTVPEQLYPVAVNHFNMAALFQNNAIERYQQLDKQLPLDAIDQAVGLKLEQLTAQPTTDLTDAAK